MKKISSRASGAEALSLEELCRFCDADQAWIMELVEHGVLTPLGPSVESWRFRGIHIARAKKARRLSRDLGINVAGIAVVLDLMDERQDILRKLARAEMV